MKADLQRALSYYFNSLLWPMLVFLAFATAMIIAGVLDQWLPLSIMVSASFLGMLLALFGILAACVWNLIKKRWVKGITNGLLLVFCAGAGFFGVVILSLFTIFGPSEDGFADHLKIPAGLSVKTPAPRLDKKPGDNDAFQSALLTALQTPGDTDPTVTANIAALGGLHRDHPRLLRRYLAAHPGWRVHERQGEIFATRRWMINTEWNLDLHGYYSKHDLGPFSALPEFQSKTTIGLSGKPWTKAGETTTLRPGQTRSLTLTQGNSLHQSRCFITDGALLLSIFEQSDAQERRMTKAALDHLQQEFQPLADDPVWATATRLLPADSIKTGPPRFELRNAFQPGIYNSIIWVNPGEAGRIYLKAFEVTKGTRLSKSRLEAASNEWIGWSDDPQELFFSNTRFTIYEGDWGQPYAARMEVWFDPDSGGPERKLLEDVFQIEGWQR